MYWLCICKWICDLLYLLVDRSCGSQDNQQFLDFFVNKQRQEKNSSLHGDIFINLVSKTTGFVAWAARPLPGPDPVALQKCGSSLNAFTCCTADVPVCLKVHTSHCHLHRYSKDNFKGNLSQQKHWDIKLRDSTNKWDLLLLPRGHKCFSPFRASRALITINLPSLPLLQPPPLLPMAQGLRPAQAGASGPCTAAGWAPCALFWASCSQNQLWGPCLCGEAPGVPGQGHLRPWGLLPQFSSLFSEHGREEGIFSAAPVAGRYVFGSFSHLLLAKFSASLWTRISHCTKKAVRLFHQGIC